MSARELPFERSFRAWIDERRMGWECTSFPTDGGGDQRCTAYRLSPSIPPRRIVVTMHGAGNDALFGWVGLFKRLLEAGSEIFTFDLPGHGRYDRTRFSAAAARAAVAGAVEASGAPDRSIPVHALGVSLGGSVLLSALPELEPRLASAALVVAPLRIELSLGAALHEVGLRTLRIVWRERLHYGLTGLIPSFGSFKRDVYPLRLAETPPPGAFGYVEVLNRVLEAMALEEAAAGLRLPVLLVYGDDDRIVPIAQGERIREAIPAAELRRVRGGTHLSTPLEEETQAALFEWMERHG